MYRQHVSWYPGSWIALKGEYGNLLLKQYLWRTFDVTYKFYRIIV